MQMLKDRIMREGRVLPGSIIKVDGFLNHRVDIKLIQEIAKEFGRVFDLTGLTAVLTVEASGIAIAAICAEAFGVPMVFAKKAKSDNIEGGLYKSDIYSYTYKQKFTLIMSRDWLTPDDKVLIVDDFLANGEAIRGLTEIVLQSGAQLIGIGIAIEKGFQPGGKRLREQGINLHSLVIVEKATPDELIFRD